MSDRGRVLAAIAVTAISTAGLVALGVIYGHDIGHALRLVPVVALVELVGIQLVSLWLRAEAWHLNIEITGAEISRSEVQAASAITACRFWSVFGP
jgi:uncharacterized membrane protein (Fun14 family)